MAVVDVYSGVSVLGDFSAVSGSPHSTPTAAYDAWAAELGVSNTTSLSGLVNYGDAAVLVEAGFTPLDTGVNTKFIFSTGGFIGFYKSNPPEMVADGPKVLMAPADQVDINRAYITQYCPSVVLSANYPRWGGRSRDAKWQTSGTTAILYVRWTDYLDPINSVTAAYKFSPGAVEVVCRATTGAGAYLQLLLFNESTYYGTGFDPVAVNGSGAFTQALTGSTTYHYRSEYIGAFSASTVPSSLFGTANIPTPSASGFSSTNFGTPTSRSDKIGTATGFLSSSFGIPSTPFVATSTPASNFGTHSVSHIVLPVSPSVFGIPATPLYPSSVLASSFGLAYGESRLRLSSVGKTSRFGTHLALNRDVQESATHAGPSGFGTPYGYLLTHPIRNVVTQADSVGASNIGVPSSPVDQAGDADGLRSTRFGTHTLGPMPTSRFGAHRSVQVQPATGFNSTLFGSHGGAYSGHASGLRTTRFGTPTYNRIHETTSVLRTRFGRASATQTGVYRAYGFCQTWFGHHNSIKSVRHATGFSASQFGAHDSHEDRVVLHIPPTSRFGVHLMTRG